MNKCVTKAGVKDSIDFQFESKRRLHTIMRYYIIENNDRPFRSTKLFHYYLAIPLTKEFSLQAALTTARRHHVRSIWLLPHAHPPVAGFAAHGRRGAQLPPRFRNSLWRNAGRGPRRETIQGKKTAFKTKKEEREKKKEGERKKKKEEGRKRNK